MSRSPLSSGLVHEMPADLAEALTKTDELTKLWEAITPIARNEFICWIENAKQDTTRATRICRTVEGLLDGQRRPCCWAGCIHRIDKAPSKSQRFVYRLDENKEQQPR